MNQTKNKNRVPPRRVTRVNQATASLDINKLVRVKKNPDKTIAQCPACAEEGRDRKGDHLVLFPNERFGCVINRSKEHRDRIIHLAGARSTRTSPPRPGKPNITIRIPRDHPDPFGERGKGRR
jgi:hypothetical protein